MNVEWELQCLSLLCVAGTAHQGLQARATLDGSAGVLVPCPVLTALP